jgi:hypothetical protein
VRLDDLASQRVAAGFGAYLHIPFCAVLRLLRAVWTDRGELSAGGGLCAQGRCGPGRRRSPRCSWGGTLLVSASLVDAIAGLPLAAGVEDRRA